MPKKKVAMSKQDQLVRAINILNSKVGLRFGGIGAQQMVEALRATFELVEQPWDVPHGALERDYERFWREGYEQCMVDIVDAISDEWGVVVWMEE